MLLHGVFKRARERLQDREICCTLQIENPSRNFCLIVIFEPDRLKCFQHLRATIINSMRFANKGHNYVAVGGLIEDHFRMASSKDLAILGGSHLGK